MMREEHRYGWCRKGLRTRYFPRARICRGLVNAAPWLNVLLLLGCFIMLGQRVVLRPGVVVDLPDLAVAAGTGQGLTAVVLSHKAPGTNTESRIEMVFFDDEPFMVDEQAQMLALRGRLFKAAREHGDWPFIIEADVHVRYGTVVNLCTMARAAGLKVVNLAGRLSEVERRE